MRTAKTTFTTAEYLAMEEVADYKSEYYNSENFAMSGGSADHSIIAVNGVANLSPLLDPKPCHVFNSDMRLLIERSGLYTYPDAMVLCGKIEFVPRRKDVLTNPILIIKVLSESTRAYGSTAHNRGDARSRPRSGSGVAFSAATDGTPLCSVPNYKRSTIDWGAAALMIAGRNSTFTNRFPVCKSTCWSNPKSRASKFSGAVMATSGWSKCTTDWMR